MWCFIACICMHACVGLLQKKTASLLQKSQQNSGTHCRQHA